jgi:chromosome segregation ATPase
MANVYDQQIKKLLVHIRALNQALQARNIQIRQWQQIATAVQTDRANLAKALMAQLRQVLRSVSERFGDLREENRKLRNYIDHQQRLHESVSRDLQGQLQYALSRINDMAQERSAWRQEVDTTRQGAFKQQQEGLEQKRVLVSQNQAIGELKQRLEQALKSVEREQVLTSEKQILQKNLLELKQILTQAEESAQLRLTEGKAIQTQFDAYKQKASDHIRTLEASIRQTRESQVSTDERIEEMTMLLANSEREVARLHKELGDERNFRKEMEIRLEASNRELSSTRRKLTKLEKERDTAKGDRLSDLQKALDTMQKDYQQLQEELANALRDKTTYMQALEGKKKSKLRSLPPPGDEQP